VNSSPAVRITISREAIEHCDPEPVAQILESYLPELTEQNRNRVQFEVAGYTEDPRELYEIPQVRAYFQALFRRYSGLFYWMDTGSGMLLFLCLMLYEPVWSEEGVTVSLSDLQSFLADGYTALSAFCREHGLSPDATRDSITHWVRGFCS
jgi:hypothetical protein